MLWHDTIHQAIKDNRSGLGSSTRIVSMMAGLTLCFCTALLTVGAFWRIEFVQVLPAFGTSLAGLATVNYAVQKWAGTKNERPE